MLNNLFKTLFLVLFLSSCVGRQPARIEEAETNPKTIITSGHVVPADSITLPRIVPAGRPSQTPAGKPQIKFANTNVHNLGKPRIVQALIPKPVTPGQDTFLVPVDMEIKGNHFLAGMPEVVSAKDSYIKDQNPHNFSTFNKQKGLKYSSVHCQTQDKNGNIWFCTYGGGVSKYDGESFTHYTEKEGLTNNRVWSILQDKDENIWFGTDGGGVSKFDGKYFTNYSLKDGFIGNTVLAILQDKNGSIWFATSNGVAKLHNDLFTFYTKANGLIDNWVLAIQEDNHGDLWFGTKNGISKFDGQSFTNFSEKEGLVQNAVLSILKDRKGEMWFGTSGGLSKFDGNSFVNYTEKEGLPHEKIYHILQDSKGMIWIATDGGGVSKLDFEVQPQPGGIMSSNSYGRIANFTVKEGLSNNIVFYVFEDRCKNLWFSTNSGVSKYNGNLFTYFTEAEGLSKNIVYSIAKDKTGNLWLGTLGGGISKYDGKSFAHYTPKEGLPSDHVFCVYSDKDENVWIGTDGGGVSKFDGKSFVNYTEKEGLCSNRVFCILQDTKGNMWFGTYGGGVSKFDGKSFTTYSLEQGLSSNEVISIFQDKDENIWIASDGGGIFRLTFDTLAAADKISDLQLKPDFVITSFTRNEGLLSNSVSSIFQDKKGTIWFGTGGGGVLRYDGETFTHFTKNEGLCNDYVLSILQDKDDNIWFGTRFGLSKLKAETLDVILSQKDTPLFVNYEYEDGFLGIGCVRSAICQDNSGQIWIGTNDRLTVYHPEGEVFEQNEPNIQLTGIELFNEKIDWANLLTSDHNQLNHFSAKDTTIILRNGVEVTDFRFDETSKYYGFPENLSLKYNNNFLTFTFIGITQNQSKKVKYQYQLVGLEDNWSAPTLHNNASYGNLAPGAYTFQIKALSSNGIWSKVYNYNFVIRPPWWKTLAFRIAFVLFVMAGFYLIYRRRVSSLEKQQVYLEQLVQEKTAEVVEQHEKLQQFNKDLLIQKEELELANSTKDKFFSIIAHDLRSPFNVFLGITEIMEDKLSDMTMDEIQELANVMRKSATNLFHLLENLLQWAQLQKGAFRFSPEKFNLRKLTEESIAAHTASSRNKNINLINLIPEEMAVHADGHMLQNIIRNLVSNALKFTPKGGKILIYAQPNEDKRIEVSVTDSGIGMSPDLINKLFRIGEHTSRFGTNNEPGTGLGLILCKEFIQKHDGEIWVESKEGHGSTVYFTI